MKKANLQRGKLTFSYHQKKMLELQISYSGEQKGTFRFHKYLVFVSIRGLYLIKWENFKLHFDEPPQPAALPTVDVGSDAAASLPMIEITCSKVDAAYS